MTAQQKFWNWFLQHEPDFFAFDPAQEAECERLFEGLASELGKVDPDLSFEFGPRGPRREFVISASGIRRAFPRVTSLVADAPRLDRWQVTAFRPRRTVSGVVRVEGRCVDAKDVQFALLDNGKIAGIHLFIPGYRDDDARFRQIGYLLLDEALGEYDVELRLGLIQMFPLDAPASGKRRSLTELPALFDRWVTELEGRSGRVS